MSGTLILAGAPLGNPRDASPRLVEALEHVGVIAAEDTRRLRRLAGELGVSLTARVVSFFEGNEASRIAPLVAALEDGDDVLVITDAGMPSVSDPGYRLVAAAAERGITVTAVPGPSAVTTALALSGLPCDRWSFEGFLPRTAAQRRSLLASLASERRTMVFFESPRRVAVSLADLAGALGADRPAALARELTKTYEQVMRGSLAELAEWAARDEPRGEITLVVAGASRRGEVDPDAVDRRVAELEAGGLRFGEAVAQVASELGTGRRGLYNLLLERRRQAPEQPHS